MRNIIPIITSLVLIPCMVQAQKSNPFKSINKEAKVHTLSNGKYTETYDDDVLQRVGTVIIDRRTNKIVKLLDADSIANEASDNSTVSRWYSIDPLAEKYYSVSPYAHCENNPVKFVDLDGKATILFSAVVQDNGQLKIGSATYHNGALYWMNGQKYNGNDPTILKMRDQLNSLKEMDPKISKVINTLDNSEKIHIISNIDPYALSTTGDYKGNYNREVEKEDSNLPMGDKAGSFTKYDPNSKETITGDKRDAKVGLIHELSHAYDRDRNKRSQGNTSNGIPLEEVDAVNLENKARAKTGDPQRDSYGGDKIPTKYLEKP